jgi:hypothetical protein
VGLSTVMAKSFLGAKHRTRGRGFEPGERARLCRNTLTADIYVRYAPEHR